jgi:hypothetical protein
VDEDRYEYRFLPRVQEQRGWPEVLFSAKYKPIVAVFAVYVFDHETGKTLKDRR